MKEYEITLIETDEPEKKIMVQEGTTFAGICEKYIEEKNDPAVLALFRGSLRELGQSVDASGPMAFVRVSNKDGKKTYCRSLIILLQKAAQNLWGRECHVRIFYSLGKSYYCELQDRKIDRDSLEKLKKEMMALVEKDIPISKYSMRTRNAEEMFGALGMRDKERLLHYRRGSMVNIYDLDGMKDYYYGYMVPSTGYLKYFDLDIYEDGFVLMYPGKDTSVVGPVETSKKLYQILRKSQNWSRMLDVGTVGSLNDAIASGRGENIILLQEALMEERIGNLARQIANDPSKKFVMIAGPSSSGKTTFANRLSIQLAAKGLKPHPLGLDDYYANRSECPRNPDGSFDFECLEALDVRLFNEDMSKLLQGERVDMPSFNFKTGMREYRGKTLQLGEEDILVIEGIHGLNEKMSELLPAESKFKIYISALTQLNIDEHNPLPTTDARLLRRIVRDARTRGTTAKETIAMWPSVRRGEERNIFPNQEKADVFFNSGLVYELSVLKVYAEPLLFQIPRNCPEYLEAKRLLKFLDYFLPLPTEGIAQNSLIREFVGGSCFAV